MREYIRQAKRYASQTLLFLVKKIVNLHGDPRHIALGFALGVFIGITPTIGAQMAIAAPLAALFKWNVCAAMIGVWYYVPRYRSLHLRDHLSDRAQNRDVVDREIIAAALQTSRNS